MLRVYGIKNCDTVKKAQKWLRDNNIDFELVDFKTTAPTRTQIQHWLTISDIKTLVNKHSKTYRELSDVEKMMISESEIESLLLKYPLLIKRPVIELNEETVLVGFDETVYEVNFKNKD